MFLKMHGGFLRLGTVLVIAVFFTLALTINLETVPGPWWDEGWTLSVARNWVDLGHYGRLKDGNLIARGLEGGFPVVSSVALSFWLFGIGILQARLVMVLYTFGALAFLYYLARRFYGQTIALATLFTLVVIAPHPDSHVLLTGRQVLGEMPSMFFLLAGYIFLLWAWEKHSGFIYGSIGFWSTALVTKAQVEPFWIVSILVPLVLVFFRKEWKLAKFLGLGLFGSKILSMVWLQLMAEFQFGSTIPVVGLTQAIALAVTAQSRWSVAQEILGLGLPTLCGLSWMLKAVWPSAKTEITPVDLVKLALFMLAGSWLTWYAVLSIGWPRYFFPPAFLSSMFVAQMLCEWTDGFNLTVTLQRCKSALRTAQSIRAFAGALMIVVSFAQTTIVLYGAFFVVRDDSLMATVEYLNTETQPRARIETYETELFPFLSRRYHYPPDQLHVDLIRKNSLGEPIKIDYDPLLSDPDYLVLGRINQFWELYDPLIKPFDFRLVQTFGRYRIYQRVRSQHHATLP